MNPNSACSPGSSPGLDHGWAGAAAAWPLASCFWAPASVGWKQSREKPEPEPPFRVPRVWIRPNHSESTESIFKVKSQRWGTRPLPSSRSNRGRLELLLFSNTNENSSFWKKKLRRCIHGSSQGDPSPSHKLLIGKDWRDVGGRHSGGSRGGDFSSQSHLVLGAWRQHQDSEQPVKHTQETCNMFFKIVHSCRVLQSFLDL